MCIIFLDLKYTEIQRLHSPWQAMIIPHLLSHLFHNVLWFILINVNSNAGTYEPWVGINFYMTTFTLRYLSLSPFTYFLHTYVLPYLSDIISIVKILILFFKSLTINIIKSTTTKVYHISNFLNDVTHGKTIPSYR